MSDISHDPVEDRRPHINASSDDVLVFLVNLLATRLQFANLPHGCELRQHGFYIGQGRQNSAVGFRGFLLCRLVLSRVKILSALFLTERNLHNQGLRTSHQASSHHLSNPRIYHDNHSSFSPKQNNKRIHILHCIMTTNRNYDYLIKLLLIGDSGMSSFSFTLSPAYLTSFKGSASHVFYYDSARTSLHHRSSQQ